MFVSTAGLFEIAIKLKIGKFVGTIASLELIIERTIESKIEILPLSNQHVLFYDKIPLDENHRDPFDRMILATALYEQMAVISKDQKFDLYKDIIDIVW